MNHLWAILLLFAALPATLEVVGRESAAHYRWGGCCDGWYLVNNDRLSVIQEKMPPASSETRHYHRVAQQFFYVLKGEGTIEVGSQILLVREGHGLLVSPGVAHRVRNLSQQDLILQVTSQPPSHADRIEVSRP